MESAPRDSKEAGDMGAVDTDVRGGPDSQELPAADRSDVSRLVRAAAACGIPAPVAEALGALAAGPPRPPDVAAGCGTGPPVPTGADDRFIDAAHAALVAREAVHNWVDGIGVECTRALHQHARDLTCPGPEPALSASQRRQWAAVAVQA